MVLSLRKPAALCIARSKGLLLDSSFTFTLTACRRSHFRSDHEHPEICASPARFRTQSSETASKTAKKTLSHAQLILRDGIVEYCHNRALLLPCSRVKWRFWWSSEWPALRQRRFGLCPCCTAVIAMVAQDAHWSSGQSGLACSALRPVHGLVTAIR